MARRIYLLKREGTIRRHEVCETSRRLASGARSFRIGVSVKFGELGGPPYPFPLLRLRHCSRCAPVSQPQPGDSLIAILELKETSDFETLFNTLQRGTIQEIKEMCSDLMTVLTPA